MKIKLLDQVLDLDSGHENLYNQLKQVFPLDCTSKIYAVSTSYNWGVGGRYNQIEISGETHLKDIKICLHFFDQSPKSKLYTIHIVDNTGYYPIIEQNPKYEVKEISLTRFNKFIEVLKN